MGNYTKKEAIESRSSLRSPCTFRDQSLLLFQHKRQIAFYPSSGGRGGIKGVRTQTHSLSGSVVCYISQRRHLLRSPSEYERDHDFMRNRDPLVSCCDVVIVKWHVRTQITRPIHAHVRSATSNKDFLH